MLIWMSPKYKTKLTGWISKPNLCPCFQAHEAWNSLLQSLQRTAAPSISPQRKHFCFDDKSSAVYESNVQKLTADHLWRVTVFRPSTNRRREASVNVISGVKTAHKTWVHPWPSVGLQARKKVSGDGHGVIVLSSFPALGQSRQSWFYSQVLGKIKAI